MPKDREHYAIQISENLSRKKEFLKTIFHQENRIKSCYIDDLLNQEEALEIFEAFPSKKEMFPLKTLRRQDKYVLMQMDQANKILEEIIYAFQDVRVVSVIAEITGFERLFPDPLLYAGGISLMEKGGFLNPHLDNSHDKDQNLYRVLNLLYYITPEWPVSCGGNLELWDHGLHYPCRTIHSKFNRLVFMITDRNSWHSVSPITCIGSRCCVSNYYFSDQPENGIPYKHITSFRGRPEERLQDILLRTDTYLRSISPAFLKNLFRRPQFYRK